MHYKKDCFADAATLAAAAWALPFTMRRGRALPQRRARAYPAHKALYKSPTHIIICIRALYTELKRKPHASQCWEGVGSPPLLFPSPSRPPKMRQGPDMRFTQA